MTLVELIDGVEVEATMGRLDVEIRRLSEDSRAACSGSLFVARRGSHHDGHDFLQDAISRGATAVLVERLPDGVELAGASAVVVSDPHRLAVQLARRLAGDPSRRLQLVGITGTNGKSTTAFLIRTLLQARGEGVGLIGTIEYQVGEYVTTATHTTPDALRLQEMLGAIADSGANHGVMEVSSHGLDQGRLEGCRFTTLVFTNLTQDHLDYHRDMERYFHAKARLFEPRFTAPGCVALINGDDPRGGDIADRTSVPVLTFGLGEAAEVRAIHVVHDPQGSRFTLCHAGREVNVATRLLGEVNVYNALAAAAFGIRQGWSLEEIADGLALCRPVPGRYQRIGDGDPLVLIDYAHTPDALARAVEGCQRFTHGRLIVVFGCGGDRDRSKRPLMGAAASTADRVVVTSDNPRSEDPLSIIREIEPGLAGCSYRVVPDRREAIAAALAEATAGDTVLIAGKGHEDYQIVGDRRLPFDDRLVAEEILGELQAGVVQ